jgi:ATP-dependent DNA ligase
MEIPIYNTLYKHRKNDKYSVWSIKIVPIINHQLKSPDDLVIQHEIIVTFGEKDGNLQTHRKTIEKGKANRSVLEQSILEANSKWNEKKNKEGYNEYIDDNGEYKIPNFIFRPMLANTFNKELYFKNTKAYKVPFPAFVQRKYDGIRCICYLHENDIVFETRKGIQIKILHLHDGLMTKMRLLFQNQNVKTKILDGELYTNQMSFETLNGLIRLGAGNRTTKDLQVDEFIQEKIKKIEYHIYDMFDIQNTNLIYEKRKELLEIIFDNPETNECSQNENIIYNVKTEVVRTIEEIKLKHDEYVIDGFEGIMIRDKDGIYEVNKRSKYLQKYKEFLEEEFAIVGFHDGEGVDKELVIWECITPKGDFFSVKPKTTFEERRKLYEKGEEYIGKMITVIFQEYTDDGIPRFPVGKAIRDPIL